MSEWISVGDHLPEPQTEEVLVLDENGNIYNTQYESCIDDGCKFGHYCSFYNPDTLGWERTEWIPNEGITHWMPLPEPPGEEGE